MSIIVASAAPVRAAHKEHFGLQVASLQGLQLGSLSCLRLQSCGYIDDNGLAALKHCPNLGSLQLTWHGPADPSQHGRGCSGAGLESLQRLTNLTELIFEGATTGLYGIAALGTFLGRRRFVGLPSSLNMSGLQLCRISFAGCSHLQDAGLDPLAALGDTLTALSLASCRSLTGKSFTALASLAKLQCLDMSGCSGLQKHAIANLTASACISADSGARDKLVSPQSALSCTLNYFKAPAAAMLRALPQVQLPRLHGACLTK